VNFAQSKTLQSDTFPEPSAPSLSAHFTSSWVSCPYIQYNPHQHDHQERVPPTPPAPPELTAHYQSPRPMRSSQMRLDPSPHPTPCSPIQLLPRSRAFFFFGAGVHFPAVFSQPPSTPMSSNSPCGWQPSTTPNHAPTRSSFSPESQTLTGTETTTFNPPQGSPSCSLKPKAQLRHLTPRNHSHGLLTINQPALSRLPTFSREYCSTLTQILSIFRNVNVKLEWCPFESWIAGIKHCINLTREHTVAPPPSHPTTRNHTPSPSRNTQ
jgi:hypothetical protein